MRRKPSQSAFTIIELIVAMAVTAVMITIVDQVYNATFNAVSTGVGLSHIIANNRGARVQIKRDGEAMIGPTGNGFLVIAYHTLNAGMPGSPGSHPAGMTGLQPDTNNPNEHLESIRDDQILFVRKAGVYEKGVGWVKPHPLMPYNSSTYSNPIDVSNDSPILVWYGHALRPKSTDTFSADPLGSGNNELASQWIFGRQAMFFLSDANHAAYNGALYANGPGPGGQLKNGGWNATVKNPMNYQGTCDVCWYGYDTVADGGIMVGDSSKGLGTPYLDANTDTSNGGMTWATYQQNALAMLYQGGYRLIVNPSPQYSTSNQYAPWQIAQMHGAMAMNVSDIQIAFAGDYYTGVGMSAPGFDGQVDRLGTNETDAAGNVVATKGSIIWYVAPGFQNVPNGMPSGKTFDPSRPVTFAAPIAATPQSGGPHTPYDHRSSDAYVWRHDANDTSDSVNSWPYLIRIRYRMHDSKAQVNTAEHVQGKWFEQIIKVARQ